MAFEEVTKTPTTSQLGSLKREYRKLEKEWDSVKYQFVQAITEEDFEVLSVEDFLRVKELYIRKKRLYWKIYELEHPEDTATREAYQFLNTMDHNSQFDFLMEHGLTTHRFIDAIRENPNFIKEVTS